MVKFLSLLNKGICAVKDEELIGSDGAVAEGEVVISEITDTGLQRLFVYRRQLSEALRKKINEVTKTIPADNNAGMGHKPEKCPRCIALAELVTEKAYMDAIADLFWAVVKDSLSLENKVRASKAGGIGLRDGWMIVTMPKKPSLSDLAETLVEILEIRP